MSYPTIRAISSIKSSGIAKSRRSNGTATSKIPRGVASRDLYGRPRRVNASAISFSPSEVPKMRFACDTETEICCAVCGVGYSSTNPIISPPATLRIRSVTARIPYPASSGEMPCSNLCDASVRSFNACAVFLTETPSKFADSIIMSVVASLTSAVFPPFTPAIPIALPEFPSAITSMDSESAYSLSSSVVIFSPFFAFLT